MLKNIKNNIQADWERFQTAKSAYSQHAINGNISAVECAEKIADAERVFCDTIQGYVNRCVFYKITLSEFLEIFSDWFGYFSVDESLWDDATGLMK